MEKRSIKDLIQTFIVDSTITKDIVLSKLKLGGKTKLAGLEDYDFKSIISNMHNNNFNYFYQCLSILLKEKDINKTELYKTLWNYKYFSSFIFNSTENQLNSVLDEEGNIIDYYIDLVVSRKSNLLGVMHELNHFASFRVLDNETIAGGFKIVKENSGFGTGLNEGFTDYLAMMQLGAFDNPELYREFGFKVYDIVTQYAAGISQVLGFDFMKKCYYNADLESLVNEMTKYSSKDETIKFITYLDTIVEKIYNKDKISVDSEEIKFCNRYMTNLSYSKLHMDVTDNNQVNLIVYSKSGYSCSIQSYNKLKGITESEVKK